MLENFDEVLDKKIRTIIKGYTFSAWGFLSFGGVRSAWGGGAIPCQDIVTTTSTGSSTQTKNFEKGGEIAQRKYVSYEVDECEPRGATRGSLRVAPTHVALRHRLCNRVQ